MPPPAYLAEKYSLYRPQYPEALYERVFGYCGCGERATAVDLGTGTGQAAIILAEHYTRVLAYDCSAEQLKEAVQRPNIQYHCSPAEHLDLPNQSVDLVTVATAFHWFDKDPFFTEMTRILKPGGVLAIWSTNCARVQEPASAAELFDNIILQSIAPYWDPRAQLLSKAIKVCAGILPPEEAFCSLERETYQIPRQCSARQIAGLAGSWSGYTAYTNQNPGPPDILQQFQEAYTSLPGASTDQVALTVTSQVSLALARAV